MWYTCLIFKSSFWIYIPLWLNFNRCPSMAAFSMLTDGVSVYVIFKYIKFTIFLKIIQFNTKKCVILGVVDLRVFCLYRWSTIVLDKLRIVNFCSQYIFFKPSFVSTFEYYYWIYFLIDFFLDFLLQLKQIRFQDFSFEHGVLDMV